jgi:hypothetical protein
MLPTSQEWVTYNEQIKMKKTESPVLTAAISYVEKYGWKVFPARMESGKKYSWLSAQFAPGGLNWGMSDDPEQVRKNFSKSRWRDRCGVGIPTGLINRIFVVDVDTVKGHGVDGIGALRMLERKHSKLRKTLKAKTPSKGIHFYFRHPGDGIKIVSRAIAPGIDCKGDGGQVAAPPSMNSSGGKYRWIDRRPIAKAPRWLLGMVQEKERAPRESNGEPQADLASLTLALAMVPNADCDWENWNRVGMALFAATCGSAEGFRLFDAWSQKSSKYTAANTLAKWQAFGRCPPNEIGAGSIFHWADQAVPGWQGRQFYDAEVITLIEEFLELMEENIK